MCRVQAFLALAMIATLISACSSDDETESDARVRISLQAHVEGTWVGEHSFTDGRPATTMTLVLRYAGSGQSQIQCGTRVLSGAASSSVSPQCATLYQLPLQSTLSMADGALADAAGSLTYEMASRVSGELAGATLESRLENAGESRALLKGTIEGPLAGSFLLQRK